MSARRLLGLLAALGLLTAACTGGSDDPAEDDGEGRVTEDSAADDAAGGDEPIPADEDVLIGALDNGLRYYIRENGRPGGTVELRLAIDAGSALEEPDQSGVAHFLEHMMFNGTEQYPENELVKVLESFGTQFGADINAYTSYDETVYSLSVPTDDPEFFDTALGVLSQWLTAATTAEADVTAERGVVLDEWRLSEQDASGRLFDAIERLFFTGTPYDGRDPIGTEDAIEGMTPDVLRRFYDEWYRPDNAAVVIVGDIDAEEVEAALAAEFSDVTDRGTGRARPEIELEPSVTPRAAVHLDPDETTGFVELTLPVPARSQTTAADLRRDVLVQLAFDMISTRLADDATRGDAPFTAASVDSNDHVRAIDAPSILLDAGGQELSDALTALITEFERVRRFGFEASELERSIDAFAASVEADFEGAGTTQDVEYADRYVGAFLEGFPIPDAETERDLLLDTLEDIELDDVDEAFEQRWAESAPHLLVVGPEDALAPTEDEALAVLDELAAAEIDNRTFEALEELTLLDPPAPVAELGAEDVPGDRSSFLAPTLLTFPNGLRVYLNETDISEGFVAFGASSFGGLSLVPDELVANASSMSTVVTSSGVGDLDQVQLERVLSDATVQLAPAIDLTSENLFGSSSTSDLEILFQLLHLYVAEPRFDDVALGTYVEELRPYVDDPTADPDLAGTVALVEARYGDAVSRFRVVPTPDELDSLETGAMAELWAERFGDVSDWVYVFSGDFDTDEVVELARTYLGTLPGEAREETYTDLLPDPPAGVVTRDVRSGTGERATLTLLYTAPVTDDPLNSLLATLLDSVVNMRLTEHIREALGASYSPFAASQVLRDPESLVESYLQVTGSPDGIEELRDVVQDDLAALRTEGPTDDEFDAAMEQLSNDLDFFSNEGLISALLDEGLRGGGIDTFLRTPDRLGEVDQEAVRRFAGEVFAADRYIEVVVTPA